MSLAIGKGESLSNVDSAWLRMETPTNLMTITGVITFDGVIEFQRLRREIEDRLLVFDRFRQRVVESRVPFVKPHWEEDDNFALKAHLRRMALPHPGDQGTLQDVIGELMSTPLDYSKPLWQFHFVENYQGGCALIGRIHHCIADGIALVRVMFSLFDEEPHGPELTLAEPGRAETRGAAPAGAGKTRRRRRVLEGGMEALLSPSRMLDLAKNGASVVGEFGKLVALSADPITAFKGKLGVTKRAVWSDAIPLAHIKSVGKQMGATINDVLLTAVSGALRRYLLGRAGVPDGLSIRAVVPVNLRPPDEPLELGNRFGLVFLGLPVGLAKPLDRLRTLKSEMDEIKKSPQAVVAFGVLNALGAASPEIESVGVGIFARKATAVMTNVPGPKKALHLAGQRIRDIMFWVPQSGRLGLGVSILSYAGNVRLGIAVDAGLVPDPGMIVTHFHEELDELAAHLGEFASSGQEAVGG
jgi:diacylglycerol O-acyltransferase / wax synthase